MKIEDKLIIIKELAKIFNENNILWAIGSSFLMYIKGITKDFNDIDILVEEKDIKLIRNILNDKYNQLPPYNIPKYETPYFMEYNIKGLDIDIISNLTITFDNTTNRYPLNKKDIEDYILDDTKIYLHSLKKWQKYYKETNRIEKSKLIEEYYKK